MKPLDRQVIILVKHTRLIVLILWNYVQYEGVKSSDRVNISSTLMKLGFSVSPL